MNFFERLEFLREAPSLPNMGNLPYVHDVEYGSILHAVLYRLVEHMHNCKLSVVHTRIRKSRNSNCNMPDYENFVCAGKYKKALPAFFVPRQNLNPDDYLMYHYLVQLNQTIKPTRTSSLYLTSGWYSEPDYQAKTWHKPSEIDQLCLVDLFYEYMILRFFQSSAWFYSTCRLKMTIRLKDHTEICHGGGLAKDWQNNFTWLMELGRRFNF